HLDLGAGHRLPGRHGQVGLDIVPLHAVNVVGAHAQGQQQVARLAPTLVALTEAAQAQHHAVARVLGHAQLDRALAAHVPHAHAGGTHVAVDEALSVAGRAGRAGRYAEGVRAALHEVAQAKLELGRDVRASRTAVRAARARPAELRAELLAEQAGEEVRE